MAEHVRSATLALAGRWCPCCKTVKLLDAFYISAQGKPHGYCKECKLAKMRERNARPEVKAKSSEYQKRYWRELTADPVALGVVHEQRRRQRRKRKEAACAK